MSTVVSTGSPRRCRRLASRHTCRPPQGDAVAAMELYAFNSEVAAAFVHPLHHVEVALRNRMHGRLAVLFGSDAWWDSAPLSDAGRRMLVTAKADLRTRREQRHLPDDMVAALSLGFWVSLLGGRYHRSLWIAALHEVFPGAARGAVHRDYQPASPCGRSRPGVPAPGPAVPGSLPGYAGAITSRMFCAVPDAHR